MSDKHKNTEPETTNKPESTNAKDWAAVGAKEAEAMQKAPEQEEQLLDHTTYLKLLNDLNKLEEERDNLRNQLLLSKADQENFKRRSQIDLENAHKYSVNKLLSELLPVIDSLEMGLAIKIQDGNDLVKQLHAGMEMTLDMFMKVLQKHGVVQINPINQQFDHNQQEAVAMQDDASVPPNTVLKVIQKGYLLKDRLVRPAMVLVSK